MMDALPFKESDLYSFGGLAIIVPMVVGGLKKLFLKWMDGKEPLVAFLVTYALGFGAKFTAKAVAFPGVSYLGLAVGLFFVALAATQIHDTVINKIIKGQDDSGGTSGPPKEKPPSPGGGA